MNQQTFKLATEAGFDIVDLGWGPMIALHEFSDGNATPEVEKLVELIVQECAHVVAKNQAEDMDWNISEIIKEHFGIK